jgi:hypothetical protein
MIIDNSANLMMNLIHGENGFHMDRAVREYVEAERYHDPYGLGDSFYSNVLNKIDTIHNSEPVRKAKAMYRKIANNFINSIDDRIVELKSIGRMQNPPPVMYRYLVANPTIRELRDKDRIAGYREVYNDPYGKETNVEHIPEYRHVVDGIYEKQGEEYVAVRYYESKDTQSYLTNEEQFDILFSWYNVKHLFNCGYDDPTDKDNGAL